MLVLAVDDGGRWVQAAVAGDEDLVAERVALPRLQAVGVRELVALVQAGVLDALQRGGDLGGEAGGAERVQGAVLQAHPGLDVRGVGVGGELGDAVGVEAHRACSGLARRVA